MMSFAKCKAALQSSCVRVLLCTDVADNQVSLTCDKESLGLQMGKYHN